MKFRILIISALVIFVYFAPSSAIKVYEDTTTWSQTYGDYKRHFKSLTKAEEKECENLLKEIIKELDTKNQCKIDNDCSLIDQSPFGATIPFPKELAIGMKDKMKNFREQCDDGLVHIVAGDDLEHTPVCWEGKCMVKSSIKDNK